MQTRGGNTLFDNETQEILHLYNQVHATNNFLIATGDMSGRGYFATLNLSESLTSQVRGIALIDGEQVVLRDEVTAHEPVNITTSWHTFAQIELTKEGKRAVLSDGVDTVWRDIQPSEDGTFEIVEHNSCINQTGSIQDSNAGIIDIAVRLSSLLTEATVKLFSIQPTLVLQVSKSH